MMGSFTVSKMKRIILHGKMKEAYSHPIEVEASTVAEAIQFLAQIPELQRDDGPWPVTIRGIDSQIALYAETDMEEIHVYPRLGGSGGKTGLFQILLGITLIGIGLINPAFLGAIGLTKGTLILTGSMMVLGGIMQMLMPVPESDSQEGSLYLGAGVNTIKIGTRIPILYGTRKIGGHYLSFDVDAKDINLEGDPNEDAEGNPNYYQYDKVNLPVVTNPVSGKKLRVVPYRAVYASPTPSASNLPVQA